MRTERQTDMTQLTVAFRYFANARNKGNKCSYTHISFIRSISVKIHLNVIFIFTYPLYMDTFQRHFLPSYLATSPVHYRNIHLNSVTIFCSNTQFITTLLDKACFWNQCTTLLTLASSILFNTGNTKRYTRLMVWKQKYLIYSTASTFSKKDEKCRSLYVFVDAGRRYADLTLWKKNVRWKVHNISCLPEFVLTNTLSKKKKTTNLTSDMVQRVRFLCYDFFWQRFKFKADLYPLGNLRPTFRAGVKLPCRCTILYLFNK